MANLVTRAKEITITIADLLMRTPATSRFSVDFHKETYDCLPNSATEIAI